MNITYRKIIDSDGAEIAHLCQKYIGWQANISHQFNYAAIDKRTGNMVGLISGGHIEDYINLGIEIRAKTYALDTIIVDKDYRGAKYRIADTLLEKLESDFAEDFDEMDIGLSSFDILSITRISNEDSQEFHLRNGFAFEAQIRDIYPYKGIETEDAYCYRKSIKLSL